MFRKSFSVFTPAKTLSNAAKIVAFFLLLRISSHLTSAEHSTYIHILYINISNSLFSFLVSLSQLNSFAFNYSLSFEALSWTDSFQFVSESSFLLFSWLSPSSSITLGCSSARTWFVRTIYFVGL